MEKKEALAVLAIVIVAIAVTAVTVYYTLRIRGRGVIKTIGLEAYADEDCTQIVSEVDWGLIGPQEVKKITLYLKNTGNIPVNMTLTTENWTPSIAADYMTLTWDYDGSPVAPDAVCRVDLILSVSCDITGVDNFAFDIVITAVG